MLGPPLQQLIIIASDHRAIVDISEPRGSESSPNQSFAINISTFAQIWRNGTAFIHRPFSFATWASSLLHIYLNCEKKFLAFSKSFTQSRIILMGIEETERRKHLLLRFINGSRTCSRASKVRAQERPSRPTFFAV